MNERMYQMENILKKAHELGELLADSAELAHLQEVEVAFYADEAAQAAYAQYEEKSAALSDEIRKGTMTRERLEAFRKQMGENVEALTQNAIAKEYLEAKSNFNRMIKQVNEILAYHIRGEEDGGCGGNCSSCSGCH